MLSCSKRRKARGQSKAGLAGAVGEAAAGGAAVGAAEGGGAGTEAHPASCFAVGVCWQHLELWGKSGACPYFMQKSASDGICCAQLY